MPDPAENLNEAAKWLLGLLDERSRNGVEVVLGEEEIRPLLETVANLPITKVLSYSFTGSGSIQGKQIGPNATWND